MIDDEDVEVEKEELEFIDNISWDTISDDESIKEYDSEDSCKNYIEERNTDLGKRHSSLLHNWKSCYLSDRVTKRSRKAQKTI